MDGFLDELRRRLVELAARSRRTAPYRIPRLWNEWGFPHARRAGRHEIEVTPVAFLLDCLERVILPSAQQLKSSVDASDKPGRHKHRFRPGQSLSSMLGVRPVAGGKVVEPANLSTRSSRRRRGGDWITRASAYSLIIRHSTAWDHDGDGSVRPGRTTETGTFLKTILLLPYLARMGINLLYLLPISKCSRKFRKGELGCPYSVKNFFELEPDLHDALLGRDAADVDLEFGALVEAAHALGMRVMIDLPPRTASRDSDLILEHPDWFYWIDRKSVREFGPPQIAEFDKGIPTADELAWILKLDVVQQHLARFRHAPNHTAPEKWKAFVERCRANQPPDLLAAIGREFGVITPPGFSDCINDPQPPWSDVTFLRLHLNHPAASVRHIPGGAAHPPYVFTDSIKADRFPGKKPNTALWRMLANVLPRYQRFGVDGARVDMGHALPPELQRKIIQRARQIDPDFCFLAEQFDHAAAKAAKSEGFNAIIGSSWFALPRSAEGLAGDFVRDVLPKTALVSLSAAETPDTPRAATRAGGAAFARASAVLIHFLPRAIPFLNSGLELLERQPMNLGLDISPPGRFALPKADPNYGKLAYFDRTFLHWANPRAVAMMDLIRRAAEIRREFLDELADPRKVFMPAISPNESPVLAVAWHVRRGTSVLIVAANLKWKNGVQTSVADLPFDRNRKCDVLLEIKPGPAPKHSRSGLEIMLPPGDVKVILV